VDQRRHLDPTRHRQLQESRKRHKAVAELRVPASQVTEELLSQRVIVVVNCNFIAESRDLGPVQLNRGRGRKCDRECDSAFKRGRGLGFCMG